MNTEALISSTPDGTRYEDRGRRDDSYPIILIHGVGLDHRMWDAQAAALAGDQRVLRYDLLGHGDTPPSAEPEIGIEDFSAQLLGVLDACDVRRAIIVGFSLGGLIAQRFAADHPNRLAGIVLMSTVYCRTADELTGVRQRLALTEQQGVGAIIDAAMARWFDTAFVRDHAQAVAEVRTRLETNNEQGYLAGYRVFASADQANGRILRAINCPALIITGTDDPGSTPAIARRMAADHPSSELVLLEGLRHMVTLEAPETITDLIATFAKRIEGPG
ncbi:MAG: alpha/beta fold hydrolase [Pseudomonadota bacterium]